MMRRTFLIALSLAVLACGKRGDPKPPVPVIPQATGDLLVTQRADRVILTWSYPSLTTAGRSLPSLRRISIYRYAEALPVPAEGRDPNAIVPGDPAVPAPIALFSKLPVLSKPQFARLATKVESIDKANLATATAGAKLIFTDAPAFTSSDGRPVRLTYAVVTEGESARGDFSNLATIVPLAVALPPADLSATADPHGVALTWSVPAAAAGAPGAPVISGYHVYRTAPGEEPNELASPITATPVTEPKFTDVPPYGEHEYRVTAVASEGPPALQSAFSAAAKVEFRDLLPPPPPPSITPLVETNSIRVIWEPVEAGDLAGYKLYRMEGAGHGPDPVDVGTIPMIISPTMETTYLNTPVDLGIAFRYAVTSVDKSGNESEKTWSPWIVAPKTP